MELDEIGREQATVTNAVVSGEWESVLRALFASGSMATSSGCSCFRAQHARCSVLVLVVMVVETGWTRVVTLFGGVLCLLS